MTPIGVMKSCFREKFGVPRQALLAPAATGHIKLNPDPRFRDAVRQLEQFSHIWVLFLFDRSATRDWRPLIETPRENLHAKVGVFASRSPDRPNAIGMSAVKLERIDADAPGGIEIHVSGLDILDGTPVLDIKPYLPYADVVPGANSGWVDQQIRRYPVRFSDQALVEIRAAESRYPNLHQLILQMMELDPRPTSQRKHTPIDDSGNNGEIFAFRLLDYDVRWQIKDGGLLVTDLILL